MSCSLLARHWFICKLWLGVRHIYLAHTCKWSSSVALVSLATKFCVAIKHRNERGQQLARKWRISDCHLMSSPVAAPTTPSTPAARWLYLLSWHWGLTQYANFGHVCALSRIPCALSLPRPLSAEFPYVLLNWLPHTSILIDSIRCAQLMNTNGTQYPCAIHNFIMNSPFGGDEW